jgi:hypothetical protein
LDKGKVTPLTGDGRHHVVKILCGRGVHSNGRAVLKFAIPEYLWEKGYDFYNIEEDGIVLVKLIKQ